MVDSAGERPSLPEGARCGVHAEVGATFTCARCGTFGCRECLFGGEPSAGADRALVCRACAAGGLDAPIPWERRREIGWVRAFVDTTKLASTQPARFFRTPSTERGAGGGILYGIAVYAVGQVLMVLSLFVLMLVSGGIVGVAVDSTLGAVLAGYGCGLTAMTPCVVAQAPVNALMGMVVAGGAAQGTLALLGRPRKPFEETLRAMGYAYAPHVWLWIPLCGPYIAYIWMLVVEFKAIRETHRVGTDAAVAAVLGFRVLFLLGLVALYTAIVLGALLFAPGPPPPARYL
jgi:hypothetical protein